MGIRPGQFGDLLGSGIFTQDGAAWKHSRSLLRPQFASNRYQNFGQIQIAVENMLDQLPENGIVDLQPLFFGLTLETTLFLLFGDPAQSVKDTEAAKRQAEFAHAFTVGQEYLTWRVRLGALYRLMSPPQYWKICRSVHRYVDHIVEKALEASTSDTKSEDSDADKKRYVFIDALIEQTRDRKVLRDQCLNILLAGRDTTACCLTWTTRLLVRDQRVLQKLRAEIAAVVGMGPTSRQPTREHLKRMSYLGIVIKEALRLYPSVPVNFRAASRMTTLPTGGGPDGKAPILVREGQGVTWSAYAMHRRKEIYGDDAYEFRPERWEGDALKSLGYAYVPFNGGPRLCLGQDFALLEVSYTVVRLLQRFPHLGLPGDEVDCKIGKEKQLLTLVVSCAEGCRVHTTSQAENVQ